MTSRAIVCLNGIPENDRRNILTGGSYRLCYNLPMKALILILLILVPASVLAQPVIVFQAEHHDFGTVRQGEKLTYTFEFGNTGTDDLVVSQVNTFS